MSVSVPSDFRADNSALWSLARPVYAWSDLSLSSLVVKVYAPSVNPRHYHAIRGRGNPLQGVDVPRELPRPRIAW